MVKDFKIADYFYFTQVSLATFESCPLKFKKRYIENIKWATSYDEQIKNKIEMGNNFHLIANRYFEGIKPGIEELTEDSELLSKWFVNLKRFFKINNNFRYLPEYKLRLGIDNLKLEANFDLILIKEKEIEIWDFKTGDIDNSSKSKTSSKYKNSLQTIVYLFVLKELDEILIGRRINYDKIKMCYWHPDTGDIICEIRYSKELHEEFENMLKNRVEGILNYDFKDFDKEIYKKHCKYCEFNWFCNSQKIDSTKSFEDIDFLNDLDLDLVAELY